MGRDAITALLVESTDAEGCPVRELLAGITRPRVSTVECPDLASALERLRMDRVDLVLLDVSSPSRPPGANTVADVRAVAPAVPIIVLTAVNDHDTALQALKDGAQDALTRGRLDTDLLARAIRWAIDRKRAETTGRLLVHEQAARAHAEETAARSRHLFQVTDILGSSLDYERTLPDVAAELVPLLADSCTVEVLEDNGEHRRIRSRDGSNVMDAAAVLAVPLATRDQELGMLRLARDSTNDPFTTEDVAFANECARKIAAAIDTARLYRAREDVIGIVSHDLRNPLNVITLALSTLDRAAATPEPVMKQMVKIRRSVERMHRLIEDLLDITRLEGGRLPMTRRSIDVAPLATDACDMLRALAEHKGITLRREVAAEIPPIHADRERMLQVLSNLLGNAIKFTPQGGIVALSVGLDGAAGVRFVVADNGPGIAAKDLPKLFNRFWQGSSNRRKGTGLGLAIAKGIVQAHGGRIGVDSELGTGSSFYFTVPGPPGPVADRAA